MKITRDVVADLWPAYESGEASADTRVLVEDFLRQDPELGRILRDETGHGLDLAEAPAPPPDADKAAVVRTQRLIRRQQWLMGLALFFTMLPVTSIHTDRLRFILWRDLPEIAVASLLAAAGLWLAYVGAGRRLRVSGL
jgi:hypothetical protein